MKTRLFISFGLSLLVSNFSMAQQVSTYAGIGEQSGSTLTPVNRTQAKFNLPYGIVFDGQGNLYISETGNHTISFMEGATEKIKIRLGGVGLPGYIDAAGTSSRFDTPKGMDVGPDNEIYVADWGNNIIRKIAKFQSISSAQMVSSIGKQGLGGHVNGNSSVAEFDKPTDVAVDASGNIYVADAGNHVIRKIDASGNVTTFAGQPGQTGNINGDKTAVAKFNAPTGVFVDANNDVYVADRMNSSIRKISGGLVTTVITGLNIPSDVVIQNNTYFITDNHRVWKYKTSLSTYAGADDNNIKGFEDNLGTWARFNITTCIVLNNSLLYVADQENHVVKKIADCSVWKPTFTIGADGKTLTASAGKYFQ